MNPAMMASAGPAQAFVVQALGFAVLVVVIWKFVLPALKKILGGRTQDRKSTRLNSSHRL